MKVTVVVDEAGQVVAAHIPSASPPDGYEGEEPPVSEFVPSEGEEVQELDLPDEDLPGEASELLELLQRHKDRA